jgi:hypothetical protein
MSFCLSSCVQIMMLVSIQSTLHKLRPLKKFSKNTVHFSAYFFSQFWPYPFLPTDGASYVLTVFHCQKSILKKSIFSHLGQSLVAFISVVWKQSNAGARGQSHTRGPSIRSCDIKGHLMRNLASAKANSSNPAHGYGKGWERTSQQVVYCSEAD